MPLYLQAGLLGLLFGPIGYCHINRFTRAAVSAGIIAVAFKIWPGKASAGVPGLVGLLLVLNLPCAIDAARLAVKPWAQSEQGA